MDTRTSQDNERRLDNKVKQLRQRLIEAQARNYELRYAGQPETKDTDLKARIDWLMSELDRLTIERKALREQIEDMQRKMVDDGK